MRSEEMSKLIEAHHKNREKLEEIKKNFEETREVAQKFTGFCIGKAFSFDALKGCTDPDMLRMANYSMQFIGNGGQLLRDLFELEIETNRQVNEILYVAMRDNDEIKETLKKIRETLDTRLTEDIGIEKK